MLANSYLLWVMCFFYFYSKIVCPGSFGEIIPYPKSVCEKSLLHIQTIGALVALKFLKSNNKSIVAFVMEQYDKDFEKFKDFLEFIDLPQNYEILTNKNFNNNSLKDFKSFNDFYEENTEIFYLILRNTIENNKITAVNNELIGPLMQSLRELTPPISNKSYRGSIDFDTITSTELKEVYEHDFITGWGALILSPFNPVFRKNFDVIPELSTGASYLPTMGANNTVRKGVRVKLLVDFDYGISRASGQDLTLVLQHLNGTGANNAVFDIAKVNTPFKKYVKNDEQYIIYAEPLFFKNIYGGVYGPIGKYSYHEIKNNPGHDKNRENQQLESPVTIFKQLINVRKLADVDSFLKNDSTYKELLVHSSDYAANYKEHLITEIKRLEDLEEKSLKKLESRFNDGNNEKNELPPVGAIFIEPIQGINGVKFYRSVFLEKLKNFAEKNKIPIFADEILTGGGRTGSFFGYQHYENFIPDFVSIGKGLQVSGVLALNSKYQYFLPEHSPESYQTYEGLPQRIVIALKVLEAIHSQKLVTRAKMFETLIDKTLIREFFKFKKNPISGQVKELNPDKFAHGVGLFYYDSTLGDYFRGSNHGFGRIMPPLDIASKDLINIFTTPNAPLFPGYDEDYARMIADFKNLD